MRVPILLAAVVTAAVALAAAPAGAQTPPNWTTAVDARRDLGLAQTELMLGERTRALTLVNEADRTLAPLAASLPPSARNAVAAMNRAAARGDDVAFAAAQARAWTEILHAGLLGAVADADRGDAAAARRWLLVREFRAPTRFTRAGTDATLAVAGLSRGELTPAAAARAVRADLLDTYDARLRATLQSVRAASLRGFDVRLVEAAALAHGYVRIVAGSYESQRGVAASRRLEAATGQLEQAARDGDRARVERAVGAMDRQLEGFRAAPLAPAEQARRAGQLDRFLRLVPIEYDRGVEAGRVTLAFEIQEAISFRDAAAAAFSDVAPTLIQRDASATRELTAILASLANALDAAGSGRAVARAERVSAQTERSLDLIDALFPAAWKDAAAGADFDVIAASLDRLANAARAGSWSRAEQARLEAYGIFELGPEQRLRGIAPSLFQRIEGLFWYGEGDHAGLVQLVKRKDAGAELDATLAALDTELVDASRRVGTGANSTASVVSNSAIVVFREGLEAVLILAALMASMIGGNRKYRRPLLVGVALAFVASAVTWVVAQTVLGSLAQYGERLEAVVSVIAIAVLLLILNWFYHRVYWAEHLAGFHQRKQRLLRCAGVGLVATQTLGLAALGFSSVYREGFETVLFLHALTLEAGVLAVLPGVLLGLAATFAVGAVTILLERKLPHRKMLIVTGVLMTWVLVILVGTTVQTFQVVGWLSVAPIDGVHLPYWAGTWLGIYPTWQGVLAQIGAATFVVGSYLAAEHVRARRRRRVLTSVAATR
ncbi:MAG: high-affinity iron transporter [Gaiellaceae bacterium]|jgi:high-affinity iron transporter|nr:high-affinity iron transporter [Gaiellaceae bacterium]